MSNYLKNLYKKQLIKQGIPSYRAELAARNISSKELNIVIEIWPEFSSIANQFSTTNFEID